MNRRARDRAWDTAWLTLLAAATVLAARFGIGLTIHVGFLPLFVAPVLAAYLARFSLLSLIAISLAATLPLLGISRFVDWLQIALLTLSGTALVGSLLSPLPLREGIGGGVQGDLSSSTRSVGGNSSPDAGSPDAAPNPGPLPLPRQARLPSRGGGEERVRQALVLIAWFAWLTWPIWLAAAWPHPAVAPWLDRLLPFNSLAAAGGVLIDLGDWTHMPIAYSHLVNLGQDVPYEPPASAWPAIVAHAALAAVVLIIRQFARRSKANTYR